MSGERKPQKIPVTAGTLREMLTNARRNNNVEAWIAVALAWADEAERIALGMADELIELRAAVRALTKGETDG